LCNQHTYPISGQTHVSKIASLQFNNKRGTRYTRVSLYSCFENALCEKGDQDNNEILCKEDPAAKPKKSIKTGIDITSYQPRCKSFGEIPGP